MFDIGWSEMAIILLVALIVIGPKDLPRVARTMGRWAGKGRAMAREFQTALEDMAREAELDKVKEEIEKAGRTNVGKTIEKTIDPSGELSKAFDPTAGGKRAGGETSSSAPAAKALDTPSPAKASPDQPGPVIAAPEPAPAAASSANSGSAKSSSVKPSRARAPSAKASAGKTSAAKPPPAKTSPAKTSPAKPAAGNSSEDRERPKAASPSERTAPVREPAPAEPS